jgi:DHA1 family chloramphenicol resistance protein-like MFS transporter
VLTGTGTAAVVAAALVPAAGVPSRVIPLAVLLAAGGFSTNPAVNARVYGILGETPTLGGVMNIAAFNVGIAVAPWVSGLVIDAAPGLAGIGRVGAAFALAAVASTLLDRSLTRRHQRMAPAPVPAGSGKARAARPAPDQL